MHVIASGVKAVSAWHMQGTLRVCREACGGMVWCVLAAAFGEGFDPDTDAAGCAGLSVTQPHWAAQA